MNYRKNTETKRNLSVKEIVPYGFDNSQTLFYIINYEGGGWEVVAADKRAQTVLASGNSNSFTMNSDNENMVIWMKILAEDILTIRLSESTKAVIADDNEYVKFWGSISKSAKTRFDIVQPYDPEGGGSTQTWYSYIIETVVERDSVGPKQLLQTRWGQNSPWNIYCPRTTDGSGTYALAGCVAVAGAQMLYFLRNRYPALSMETYSYASCLGNINNYDRRFQNWGTSVWNYMALSLEDDFYNQQCTAVLIAYVGELVGINYGNNGSGANEADLVDDVFAPCGISCTFNGCLNYDVARVKNSLLNDNMPVIVSAYRDQWGQHGHSWVIDGCRQITTTTTNYCYVTTARLTHSQISQLTMEDVNDVESTAVHNEVFHMNWGWSGSYNDAEYSTSTSGWLPNRSGNTNPYEYYVTTISGFVPE